MAFKPGKGAAKIFFSLTGCREPKKVEKHCSIISSIAFCHCISVFVGVSVYLSENKSECVSELENVLMCVCAR